MNAESIPYRDDGPSDGPAVLLVHPLGADQTFWDACRKHLDKRIRSISCNLRGARGGPPPAAPVTLAQSVADIEAVREALGVETMIVAGCAVGAMAAAAYAARHPERVSGLVLSNPALEITPAAGEDLARRAEAVRKNGMTALLPAAIENAFRGYEETAARRDYERDFVAQAPEGYAMAALGVVGASVAGDLARIACPVLLIAGGNDILLPVQQAEKCRAILPDSELVVLDRGAHFIPYQEPEWFAGALNRFAGRNRKAQE